METMRIKCPNCGAILIVATDSSNQGKSIKCPVCKEKHRFTEFKVINSHVFAEDKTNLSANIVREDRTVLPSSHRKVSFGFILDQETNRRYTLIEGLNLIGRKIHQGPSLASVPIETKDRGFSRKHLFIEVFKRTDGVVRYYAYNASNKNPTTINGVLLNNEDKIILHNNDVICSSNTTLIFKEIDIPFNLSGDNIADKGHED